MALRQIFEALTFNQLFRLSEPRRVTRSLGVTGPPLDISVHENSIYWGFNFKAAPSTTGLRHHGYIRFLKPRRQRVLGDLECVVECNCVSGDTLVLMGDGTYKPISEIRPGDTVYTHRGRVRRVLGNVERPLRPGERVYELDVAGFLQPITITGGHPVYVFRGNETCRCGCGQSLPNITEGSSFCAGRLTRTYIKGHHPSPLKVSNETIKEILADWQREQSSFGELARRHMVSESTVSNIVHGRSKMAVRLPDEPDFRWVKVEDLRSREWGLTPWLEEGENSLDPHLARFLGYYAAEGFIPNASNQVHFSLHLSEKKTLGKDLVEIVTKLSRGGLFRVSNRYSGNLGKLIKIYDANSENLKRPQDAFALTCYTSPEFTKFILDNVGRGSHEKRLSDLIMGMNNETLRQFIIGLFLGDGHIKKNGHVRYSSMSWALLSQASTILNRLKIRHNLTRWGVKRGYDIAVIDVYQGESAQTLFDWLSPYLRPTQLERRNERQIRDVSIRNEGYLRMLSRCESSYAGTVWDLAVEDDESFIINGISFHNCQDYVYRWAWTNKQRGSSRVGPDSVTQCLNRAPRITNPGGHSGLCKHLLALSQYIRGLMSPEEFPADNPDGGRLMRKLVKYSKKRWGPAGPYAQRSQGGQVGESLAVDNLDDKSLVYQASKGTQLIIKLTESREIISKLIQEQETPPAISAAQPSAPDAEALDLLRQIKDLLVSIEGEIAGVEAEDEEGEEEEQPVMPEAEVDELGV